MVIGDVAVAAGAAIAPGDKLYVAVGGTATGNRGGFNVGGHGRGNAGGGGGATEVRTCSRTATSCRKRGAEPADTLIVAAGGGGAGGCAMTQPHDGRAPISRGGAARPVKPGGVGEETSSSCRRGSRPFLAGRARSWLLAAGEGDLLAPGRIHPGAMAQMAAMTPEEPGGPRLEDKHFRLPVVVAAADTPGAEERRPPSCLTATRSSSA